MEPVLKMKKITRVFHFAPEIFAFQIAPISPVNTNSKINGSFSANYQVHFWIPVTRKFEKNVY
jgi:hypothetical protein